MVRLRSRRPVTYAYCCLLDSIAAERSGRMFLDGQAMTEQQHQSTYSGGSSTQAQPQLSPVWPRSLTAHGLKLPRNLQTSVAHMVRFSCSAREHVPIPTYIVRPRVAPVCPIPLRSRGVRSHCLPVYVACNCHEGSGPKPCRVKWLATGASPNQRLVS